MPASTLRVPPSASHCCRPALLCCLLLFIFDVRRLPPHPAQLPPGTLILLIPPPPPPPTPPTPTHPHTTTTTTHLPPHPCPTAGCRRTRRSCRSAGPPPRCRTACSAWAPTCPASCPSTPVSFLGGRGDQVLWKWVFGAAAARQKRSWVLHNAAPEAGRWADNSSGGWALRAPPSPRCSSACSACPVPCAHMLCCCVSPAAAADQHPHAPLLSPLQRG